MDDFLLTIETFLSAQPWWAIALGSAFLVLLLSGKFGLTRKEPVNFSPPFLNPNHDSVAPLNISTGQSHSIRVVANSLTAKPSPNSVIQSTELSFEGDDAQKLHALIRAGDKINAIKFVREKKQLQLVDAKNIVEAIEKMS